MGIKTTVINFLNTLEFGKYILHENDCDVMACKAREAMKLKFPELPTGITVMFGFTFNRANLVRSTRNASIKGIGFAGHGILAVDVSYAETLYYDCTTIDGKDSCRPWSVSFWKLWSHYMKHGYLVLFWYTVRGDYEPA